MKFSIDSPAFAVPQSRNLLSSLFLHGSLITTDAKAKEVKRRADILIGLAKRDTLAARRHAAAELFGSPAVRALFERWGKAFDDRSSGYTRSVKIRQRQGDAALMTLVELIGAAPAAKAPEAGE